MRVIGKVNPEYVSYVIQINTDEKKWKSDSPFFTHSIGLMRYIIRWISKRNKILFFTRLIPCPSHCQGHLR